MKFTMIYFLIYKKKRMQRGEEKKQTGKFVEAQGVSFLRLSNTCVYRYKRLLYEKMCQIHKLFIFT